MSLSQRVREGRYAKGWGPDELASRADISRTALYQIECGKTELPRAGTLRRIAQALEVSVDVLLGEASASAESIAASNGSAGGALSFAGRGRPGDHAAALADGVGDDGDGDPLPKSIRRAPTVYEHDLERKFQEVLASPLGEGMARIVVEAHRLLSAAAPRSRD